MPPCASGAGRGTTKRSRGAGVGRQWLSWLQKVKRRVTRYRFIVRTTGGLESSYGVTGSERWPFKHAERRRAPLSSFPSAHASSDRRDRGRLDLRALRRGHARVRPRGVPQTRRRRRLARHGVGDGTPGLLLVPVPVVAAPEVGERHGERPVLHLPDMAELVADQVVARPFDGLAEQDGVPGRIAVETAEPGEAEEARPHEHPDAVDPHRRRIELQAVEPGLGPRERGRDGRSLAHAADHRALQVLRAQGTLPAVRVALGVLVLTLALALVPGVQARPAHVAGQLPTRGIFVPGVSLAGVHLGFDQARVKAALGSNYRVCTVANTNLCKEPLWLYEYQRGEPLGVAVRFHNKKVTAVFTLGAIQGWKTSEGLKMYDPVSNIYSLYETPIYSKCIGFEAFSMKKGGITSSFYTASGVVYGFALTAPGEAICQ